MGWELLQNRGGSAVGAGLRIASLISVCAALACDRHHDDESEQLDSAVQTGGDASDEDAGADLDAEPNEADAADSDDASANGSEAGDASPDATLDADTSPPDHLGMACERDEQCSDGVYCNGTERCAEDPASHAKKCAAARREPCPPEHACQESSRSCDCSVRGGDFDRDGQKARVCGGTDCNDNNDRCYEGHPEVCDDQDVDEDCRPETVGYRDQDGDNQVDHLCRNYDPDRDVWNEGPDCNDRNPSIHVGATEVCDYSDNNCNGYVDEKLDKAGLPVQEDGGLRLRFVPDFDRDQHGRSGVEPILACDFTQPPGYVQVTAELDCDDTRKDVYAGAPELCDKVDNDCDGKVDADDTGPDGLVHIYDFPGTKVSCVDGDWTILPGDCPNTDVLYCPAHDPIEQGCRTNATHLSSCRACNTDCQFSCGEKGCDEIADVGVGEDFACARTTEGRVACWGRGALGRLANDATTGSAVPQSVIGGLKGARLLALGTDHACAVAGNDSSVFCWGSNATSQLGTTDVARGSSSLTPVQVKAGYTSFVLGASNPFLTKVVSVDASSGHTCAVLESGHLACWGSQLHGLLGNGVADSSDQPIPDVALNEDGDYVTDAVQVSLGDSHGCIVTRAGEVKCWGENGVGQLGQDPGVLDESTIPLLVPGLQGVTAIATGGTHTCALASAKVWCWGENVRKQLGRGASTSGPAFLPEPVVGLADVKLLFSGRAHTCAIDSEGHASCWGANNAGQLSRSPFIDTATPVSVPIDDVVQGGAGGASTCAVTGRNAAYCWGENRNGQLGNGETSLTAHPSPSLVQPLGRSRY